MGHDLSAGGTTLRDRLASYLGRDTDRGFLTVLGALILVWTTTTAVVFGCGAYHKLAAMPQISPIEPSWAPVSCTAETAGARCTLSLPKARRA